jgi:hypothetical protein
LSACSSTSEAGFASDAGLVHEGGAEAAGDDARLADAPSAGDDGSVAEAGPCNDTAGDVSACAAFLDPDANAMSPNNCLGAGICGNITSGMKQKIAERAIKCLQGLPSCNGSPTDCPRQALVTACTDPTASTPCAQIAGTCGYPADAGADDDGGGLGGQGGVSLSPRLCNTVMSGLTNDGRAQLQGCLTNQGCASDLLSCLGQIF